MFIIVSQIYFGHQVNYLRSGVEWSIQIEFVIENVNRLERKKHSKQFAHWVKSDGTRCKVNIKRSDMLGVREISCICITRFARRKGAVVFEVKILSVDLNAYSEMRTIKYLSFIPETRDLADASLPVECHTSTCGNRWETNIRTQDTLKNAAICMVLGNKF